LSKTTKMTEDDFRSLISDLWNYVHDEIGPIREETFKLISYWSKAMVPRVKDEKTDNVYDENSDLKCYYQSKTAPQDDDFEKLEEFAGESFTCARAFQEATQKLLGKTPREVLRITTRAGVLLYYTEQILLRYDGLKELATKDKPLPTNFGTKILSDAMTVAATARDHIIAADGYIKNLKEMIGTKERRRLLAQALVPAIIVYLTFNPSTFHIPLIPPEYRVYWEVLFWSLFGAISISFITMSEDVNGDVFDPRHLLKYEYRIPVAPFVATVDVLFVSLIGLASGNTTIKLDLANPNFPVVVVLSFLFGFFGKRSLDLLDEVWQKLVPSTRPKEDQKTPKTNGS
jgi:hypothetical protein